MAEVFGTVAGALSVAALFNNCVACFEYIQLSHHFREDFDRASKRYANKESYEAEEIPDLNNMQLATRNVHSRLGFARSGRSKATGVLKKAAWALYDEKSFRKMIEELTGFVDDLEKLISIQVDHNCHQQTEMEICEIDDEEGLTDCPSGCS
ncbi:hypothetical protein GGR53DRAFT_466984 [Hypoxylon sp. FL1150]|nr:hypothetical protein GGR53DRAFT_466984 [Hypoxylon sp. FL1150]